MTRPQGAGGVSWSPFGDRLSCLWAAVPHVLVNGSLSLRHRVGPLCDPLTRRVLVYSMQRTSRDATFEKTWESGGCSLLRPGGERAGSQAAPGGQAALSLSTLGTTVGAERDPWALICPCGWPSS